MEIMKEVDVLKSRLKEARASEDLLVANIGEKMKVVTGVNLENSATKKTLTQ
jgi:hypothetical protein